jgi:hypothetical protein
MARLKIRICIVKAAQTAIPAASAQRVIIAGIQRIPGIVLPVVRFISAGIVNFALIVLLQRIAKGVTNALPVVVALVATNAAAVGVAVHAQIAETAATAYPA